MKNLRDIFENISKVSYKVKLCQSKHRKYKQAWSDTCNTIFSLKKEIIYLGNKIKICPSNQFKHKCNILEDEYHFFLYCQLNKRIRDDLRLMKTF